MFTIIQALYIMAFFIILYLINVLEFEFRDKDLKLFPFRYQYYVGTIFLSLMIALFTVKFIFNLYSYCIWANLRLDPLNYRSICRFYTSLAIFVVNGIMFSTFITMVNLTPHTREHIYFNIRKMNVANLVSSLYYSILTLNFYRVVELFGTSLKSQHSFSTQNQQPSSSSTFSTSYSFLLLIVISVNTSPLSKRKTNRSYYLNQKMMMMSKIKILVLPWQFQKLIFYN